MTPDLRTQLLQGIDAPLGSYGLLESYYRGEQPLAFLAPESRKALGDRFGRMSSNLCRLAITSIAERLRVTGFEGLDIWDSWLRNDLDQTAGLAHREALLLGSSYVVVWADSQGRPQVSVESARQMSMIVDPGTRRPIAAAKRWTTDTTTEATIFEADTVTRLRANNTGAVTAGFQVVEVLDNPLGVVPVVRLTNTDRILDSGVSEIADLMPLVDGLNKILADALVSSEFFARPKRWATGVELVEEPVLDDDGEPTGEVEEVSPIAEDDRMVTIESPEAKLGQLSGADLGAYEAGVRMLLGQIMAVSSLPAHYIGVTSTNPSSAEAMRAAEASLTARAESKQQLYGRSWEQVARLVDAVANNRPVDTGVTVRAQWADAATRSIAAEADAITKLYQSGLLPADYALAKLGYSETEIAEIRVARRTAELDRAAVDLTALVP